MKRHFSQRLVLLTVIACFGTIAYADVYGVGVLSYDAISGTQAEFDITNYTGPSALSGFPLSGPGNTPLNIHVTSLVVNFLVGPSVTLTGADFTSDASGDENCDVTADAACNFFGDNIASAVLTGTYSPMTGLGGLTAPDTSIEATIFGPGGDPSTATLTPSIGPVLVAGVDSVEIAATGTNVVPEPQALILFGTIVGALFIRHRSKRLRGGAV